MLLPDFLVGMNLLLCMNDRPFLQCELYLVSSAVFHHQTLIK